MPQALLWKAPFDDYRPFFCEANWDRDRAFAKSIVSAETEFGVLINKYQRQVHLKVYRFANQDLEKAELVNEVFYQVYASLNRYRVILRSLRGLTPLQLESVTGTCEPGIAKTPERSCCVSGFGQEMRNVSVNLRVTMRDKIWNLRWVSLSLMKESY